MTYIKDIKEDDHIIGHYLCKQKLSLKSRNGKTYLSLKLQDRTGVVDAKVWELNNDIQNFEENDYIKIEGVALLYQNEAQIKISRIRRSDDGEYDPADYIPRTPKDIAELMNKLNGYIFSIGNPFIKELLTNILIKNNQISKAVAEHSAAKALHHSYLGGLLEHTVSVTQICEFLCGVYPKADRDLLICAALLHDIGKVYELAPFPANNYTDDGRLLGHIFIGAELVSKEALLIANFPEKLESLIKHCILSHHGEYEFGSPKRPKIIEAFILFCVDNMDAKTNAFETALESETLQDGWSQYNKSFERYLRKTGL